MVETRLQQIRRRHRPGFDPRNLGRDRQCVRCRTPWPCDVIYVLERIEAELVEVYGLTALDDDTLISGGVVRSILAG